MTRQTVIGDKVLYLQRGSENEIILSPAIVTGLNNDKTVSLFVMQRSGTRSFESVSHGCEHGQWFFKGEFGLA